MKFLNRYRLLLLIPIILFGTFIVSCSDDEDSNGGNPVIHYVRVTDPAKADSLLVGAFLGNLVAIIGDNLGDTREVWFNDKQAQLAPTYVTNETILVSVPNSAPTQITDQIKLVFDDGSFLTHDFVIEISAPEVTAMRNEYAPEGSTTVIEGDFFFEPVTITFTGGVTAEVEDVDQTSVSFTVPEGALSGPVTVSTNFGTTISGFHYKDQRNLILNYDDLTAAGSWRPGPTESVDPLDGNYLKLFGTLNANDRIEDNFESQFWGHTRLPEGNLFTGEPENNVLKFEARVVEWYGSYLQICWGPWDNADNQEVWSNLNGRGLWRPWEETGESFSTDGEWITVSIPLTEMKYSHNQDSGDNAWVADMKFDKNIAGSLSFWVIATPDANASPVEIHIDNVRIVPN